MRLLVVLAVLMAHAVLVPAAHAAEPFKLYDKFSDRPLDPARWQEGERVRYIKGGALHLMQRTWSSDAIDFNYTSVNWSSPLANPATVSEMRARITVNAFETNVCQANPLVSDSRARIIGGFFNIDTPQPGSMTNDVIAQLRVVRFSNSSDPAGVLRVEGVVSLCLSSDCSAATTIGSAVPLGTVHVGAPTTVQMQWDEGGHAFHFSREGGHSGSVGYSFPKTSPPGFPFAQMATRVNVPNCTAGRLSGMVDAKFDNVFVNQTAKP